VLSNTIRNITTFNEILRSYFKYTYNTKTCAEKW